MARMHKWLGIALIGLSLTGCVSQEKYQGVVLQRDQLAEQAGTAEASAKTAEARANALQEELNRISQSGGISSGIMNNLQTELANLKQENQQLKDKLDDALHQQPQIVTLSGSMLPAPLTSELSQFAAANSDIVDFDAARGVVKFKSDVTFAPGSTDVSSKAKSVLQRFVQILVSPAASGYDLMVVGHTDNSPVVRQATKENGNFDNWYLSTHRAIAVGAELVADGVNKGRLGVAGYADQRPIASNSTEAGKAQNRRVEVLILPTTSHGTVSASSAVPAAHLVPAKHKTELNKDGVSSTEEKPMLSK